MKKLLLTISGVLLLNTGAFAESFSDVATNSPYFEASNYLSDQNIITGYSDDTFKPLNEINRAELVKILVSGKNLKLSTNRNCFPDVPYNAWYAPYICAAVEQGYLTGYPDGTFRPEQVVNKAEALRMMAEIYDWDLQETANAKIFKDTPEDAWYAPYVKYAKAKNLLVTNGDYFNPSNNIRRGSVAETLYRSFNVSTAQTLSMNTTANLQMKDSGSATISIKTINGLINDAMTAKKISANVALYDNNDNLLTSTSSDNEGKFQFDEVPIGSDYYFSFTRDGYLPVKVPVKSMYPHVALSPNFNRTNPEDLRIVLTWGDFDVDFDAHLIDPKLNEYYFMNRGSAEGNITLNTSSTNPLGTETITINEFQTGDYTYFVHKYSGEKTFYQARARIEVYNKGGLVKMYYPAQTDAPIWKVFTTNEQATITNFNTIGNCESGLIKKSSAACY